MGSLCLLSDGGLPSVSCVTHYSFVRLYYSFPAPRQLGARSALSSHGAQRRVEMGASLGTTASGAPARFPVGTWIAAGACLAGLALSERFIVGPLRKQQEAEGTAPGTSIFGDIAAVTGEAHTKKQQAKLPDGLVLLDDGSIKRKP